MLLVVGKTYQFESDKSIFNVVGIKIVGAKTTMFEVEYLEPTTKPKIKGQKRYINPSPSTVIIECPQQQ